VLGALDEGHGSPARGDGGGGRQPGQAAADDDGAIDVHAGKTIEPALA
jgi:hypothetical protein